jgi:hypothetical protein
VFISFPEAETAFNRYPPLICWSTLILKFGGVLMRVICSLTVIAVFLFCIPLLAQEENIHPAAALRWNKIVFNMVFKKI